MRPCLAGTKSKSEAVTCDICESGTYSGEGAFYCALCPEGKTFLVV